MSAEDAILKLLTVMIASRVPNFLQAGNQMFFGSIFSGPHSVKNQSNTLFLISTLILKIILNYFPYKLGFKPKKVIISFPSF